MNKQMLFNRSAFSKTKGHDVKRTSSKGLLTGIVLAGTILLLSSPSLASADEASTPERPLISVGRDSQMADKTAEDKNSQGFEAHSTPSSSETEVSSTNSLSNAENKEASDTVASSSPSFETYSSDVAKADKFDNDDDDDDDDDKKHKKSKDADIYFDGTGVRTTSSSVISEGKAITITSAGTYTLSGTANGYSIVIAEQVTDRVKFKFDAVHLTETTIYAGRDLEVKIKSDSSLSSFGNTIETGGALYISSKKKSRLSLTSAGGHAIKTARLNADKVILSLSSANKDGINANSKVTISKSTLTISAGDDGIQVKDKTDVNAGDIEIKDSSLTITSTHKGITASDAITVKGSTNLNIKAGFEGIEGRRVNLEGGSITIRAEDDAINAVEWTSKKDADLSQLTNSVADIKNKVAIVISGANIDAISKGDGMDSNGDLIITKGSLKTQSITDYNSALDYDGAGSTSGGTTWAIGHMGFAQGFSTGTKQSYVSAIVSGLAGDTITITDSKGRIIAQTRADVDFDHIVFSDKVLKEGKNYTVTSSDGHKATVTATRQTTPHPSGRIVDKNTVPLLPNGHHPAFPGNGTPPKEDKN